MNFHGFPPGPNREKRATTCSCSMHFHSIRSVRASVFQRRHVLDLRQVYGGRRWTGARAQHRRERRAPDDCAQAGEIVRAVGCFRQCRS